MNGVEELLVEALHRVGLIVAPGELVSHDGQRVRHGRVIRAVAYEN